MNSEVEKTISELDKTIKRALLRFDGWYIVGIIVGVAEMHLRVSSLRDTSLLDFFQKLTLILNQKIEEKEKSF